MNENKEIISELVEKFKISVPPEERELVQEFEKYLHRKIQNLSKSRFNTANDEKAIVEPALIAIAENLINSDLQSKKRELLRDENFSKVADISYRAFQMAQEKLNGKDVNIDFNIEEEIEKMEQMLSSVESYNMEQAETLVSEGILDLKYLENPKTEIYSFRLAHIKDWNEQANKSMEEDER